MTDGTGTTSYSYYPVTATGTLGAAQLQTVTGPLSNSAITYSYDELGRVVSRAINGVAHLEEALKYADMDLSKVAILR